MNTFTQFLVSWGPMLLLIAAWFYFMRRSGGMRQGQYFDEVRAYMKEHVAETKRLNANLERIAATLESTGTGSVRAGQVQR
jgi:ATP-dependent Zn protease